METAFTMSNKNYYACKVCDAVVHNSLDCPDCSNKYEVVIPCEDCEGQGTIQVDPLNDHWDHNCYECDGTGVKTRIDEWSENISEVSDIYQNAISIKKIKGSN